MVVEKQKAYLCVALEQEIGTLKGSKLLFRIVVVIFKVLHVCNYSYILVKILSMTSASYPGAVIKSGTIVMPNMPL